MAREHNIDPSNPAGSDVARYLSDLHLVYKLSYNTILLHKSAISTLCNAECAGALSSHVLIRHVLKSISIQKPMYMSQTACLEYRRFSFISGEAQSQYK